MLKRLAALAAVLTCVALGPLHAAAQDQPPGITIINTLAEPGEHGTQVSVYFTPTDAQGHPVAKDTFGFGQGSTLQIAGAPGDPASVSVEQPGTPLKIALVLDASGSMARTIQAVREAAKKAVDAAPAGAQFAVFQFTRVALDNPFLPIRDFTNDKDLVKKAIEKVDAVPGGETCLYNAAYRAIDYVDAHAPNPQDRRAIILFTDGKDDNGRGKPCSQQADSDVIALAKSQPATPIYTIGMGDADHELLGRIARETAGFAAFGQPGEIESAFVAIMEALKSQLVARADVCLPKGHHDAILRLPGAQPQNVSFEVLAGCDPAPALSIDEPHYDQGLDAYHTTLRVANPQSVGTLSVVLIEHQDGASLKLREQTLQIPANTTGTFTLPYTITAESDDPGTSLESKHTYYLWLKAADKAGKPIARAPDNSQFDATVLAYAPLGAYEPRFEYAIRSATANADGTKLQVLLNVHGAGKRELAVEGDVLDDTQPIGAIERTTPSNIRDFTVALPEKARPSAEAKTYTLKLRIEVAGQPLERSQQFTMPAVERESFITSQHVAFTSVALLIALLLGWLLYRQRRQAPGGLPIPPYTPVPDATPAPIEHTSPPAAPAPISEATVLAGDATQLAEDSTVLAAPRERWFVEVVAGGEPARFALGGQRAFEIGRATKGHRPDIALANTQVSRRHARVEPRADAVELIAGESGNGTFTGDEQRPLAAGERATLRPGDVFWLGPAIKLRVVCEPA